MKPIHRKIQQKQARVLMRVVKAFRCKKVPGSRDRHSEDYKHQQAVAHNNRQFNPIKSIAPGLSAGQKAAMSREVIRSEQDFLYSPRGIPNGRTITWSSNFYEVKVTMRQYLEKIGRIKT